LRPLIPPDACLQAPDLSVILPATAPTLASLIELELWVREISDLPHLPLRALTSLTFLHLGYTRFQYELPAVLLELPSLRMLSLAPQRHDWHQLRLVDIALLQRLPNLACLRFGVKRGDEDVTPIASKRTLRDMRRYLPHVRIILQVLGGPQVTELQYRKLLGV
jgi:hypothetical protein